MKIPCCSDKCQEEAMRKILLAAEAEKYRIRLGDHNSYTFKGADQESGKKFSERRAAEEAKWDD